MENVYPQWPGWETTNLIGKGGFGSVYEIRRTVFDTTERAALKFISIPQSESEIAEMFNDGYDHDSIVATYNRYMKELVNEYSLMRKMSSCPNIVKCDDMHYTQHENGIGWDFFIKMELLTPLTAICSTPMTEDQIRKLGMDLCNALIMCKRHGVIHRDIKPQNIFVSENGDFKLGDFGIAKTIDKTTGGTKIGTYKYMAPEIYNNQPYGTSADIYSLGLVLYWLLNEHRLPFLPLPTAAPHYADEEQARIRRFRGEPIPPPKYGCPALKAIVLKACAFHPCNRYTDAAQMLEALRTLQPGPIMQSDDATVHVRKASHVVSASVAARTEADSEKETKVSAAKIIALFVSFLLCITMLIGLLLLFTRQPEVDDQDSGSRRTTYQTDPTPPTDPSFPTLPTDPTATNPTTEPPKTTTATQNTEATVPPETSDEPATASVQVGDYITLGSYEQDGNLHNGAEDIQWLVADIQDGTAILVSRYALDCRPYLSSYAATSWATSDLRTWLNSEFYSTAFSQTQRQQILTTTLDADTNPVYNTRAGDTTQDKVFILNLAQAETYFSGDNQRSCEATPYAISQGVYIHASGDNRCWWWLRTPGVNNGTIAGVNRDGSISYRGTNTDVDSIDAENFNTARPGAGVRPVIRITLPTQ